MSGSTKSQLDIEEQYLRIAQIETDIAMLNAIREHRRALASRHAAMRRPPIWLVGAAGALSGIALTAIVIYLAHITPPIFH